MSYPFKMEKNSQLEEIKERNDVVVRLLRLSWPMKAAASRTT